MPREHDERGDFTETVAPEDVFTVFDHVRGPVLTSADVADALGCARETARRKLTVLYEEGRVDNRKTAGRIVWWRTDAVDDAVTTLKRLSQELDEPITVGETVYEDGDMHQLTIAEDEGVNDDA